ncbi:MAG: hypothetical protein OQL27_13050 [Sedimenticola sp.]|nr:hypothetical protein [Sedimenticola sp.]
MPRALVQKIALTLLVTGLIALTHLGSLDRLGHEYTEAGFKRALVVFALSRGLNGVISVAQGTEVAIEPVGIGLTFKPGEILDPVNDLVERFSWVMLTSSASFGVQRVLLDVMASSWLTYATLGAGLALLWALWWTESSLIKLRRVLCRIALVLLVLRFSIALMAVAGEHFYQAFLETQFNESQIQLEKAATHIGEVNSEIQPALSNTEERSLLDEAKRVYDTATRSIDIESRMATFNQAATNISEHAIQMIVVFLMQTVLFPLASIWLIWQLLKRLLRARLEWVGRDQSKREATPEQRSDVV